MNNHRRAALLKRFDGCDCAINIEFFLKEKSRSRSSHCMLQLQPILTLQNSMCTLKVFCQCIFATTSFKEKLHIGYKSQEHNIATCQIGRAIMLI